MACRSLINGKNSNRRRCKRGIEHSGTCRFRTIIVIWSFHDVCDIDMSLCAFSGRTGLSRGPYFMGEFSPFTKIPNPLRVGMWYDHWSWHCDGYWEHEQNKFVKSRGFFFFLLVLYRLRLIRSSRSSPWSWKLLRSAGRPRTNPARRTSWRCNNSNTHFTQQLYVWRFVAERLRLKCCIVVEEFGWI